MTFKGWDKKNITSDDRESVEAITPIVISASRSTDIPAFYSRWFINRLEKGYVKWLNPFNRKPQYVSFDNARVIVFWTKNPKPLIPLLDVLDERRINYYFQFTVNDYVEEHFEPNVPPLDERIDTFRRLSEKIGKEKVIWRFDPLLLTNELNVSDLLSKIAKVGQKLYSHTEKLVFSFADISVYRKVQNNLRRAEIAFRDFDRDSMHQLVQGLRSLNEQWGIKLATCGEQISLEKYGVEHNKCIDDDVMIQLFKDDQVLMRFLGFEKTLFNSDDRPKMKDKGQRKECGCIFSKDIGMYNTCKHLCVYCYANTSQKAVENNWRLRNDSSDSIV